MSLSDLSNTMPSTKQTIFFVSTFPPRECGLATFTYDLLTNFEKTFAPFITAKVIAINDSNRNFYIYPGQRVVFQIQQDERADYAKAADYINREQPALVCIQHEFGIFGGMYGAYILELLKRVRVPRAIVFHTVLPDPQPLFRKRVEELSALSERFIVMTCQSKEILTRDYGISTEKISVIPHGIPAVPFESSGKEKGEFGLEGHTVLTTFGLLSRNKGIEYVLRALPLVVQKYPDVIYLVVGATHPNVLKKDGEKYRKSLFAEVKRLGLTRHVRFYNKYFDLKHLIQALQMTDIYIATSLDPHQAVSGTLSYAIGVGRPVLSTNFSQARELVVPSIGKLVPVRDETAYSQALLQMLSEPEKLQDMGYLAYSGSRHMTWGNVANAYAATFASLVPTLRISLRRLPVIKLSHLERMTTKHGILQFCRLAEPWKESGYTLDDNARALLVTAMIHKQSPKKGVSEKLASIYLDFVLSCQPEAGLLLNIFHFDHSPDDAGNSLNREEGHTRALLALSFVSALSDLPEAQRTSADRRFETLVDQEGGKTDFDFPRAQANFIKALAYMLEKPGLSRERSRRYLSLLEETGEKLIASFEVNSGEDWNWFESELTYGNAVMPEALLIAARVTGNPQYRAVGETALDFLLRQTIIGNQAWPIGQSGWFKRGGVRPHFDQQPEEASSLVLCLRAAYDLTGNEKYRRATETVFSWFLGNNALGLMVYDESTGGCFDGLTVHSVNLNQGSESTVCYLLARHSIADPISLIDLEGRS